MRRSHHLAADAFLCIVLLANAQMGLAADRSLQGDLESCKAISNPDDRLRCYDAVAGSIGTNWNGKASAIPVNSINSQAKGGIAPPAPLSPDAHFGLPAASPPPDAVAAVHAKVASIGTRQGHVTVSLENGQTWLLLDDSETRLDVGIEVTVKAAALDSFLLTGRGLSRAHRVRRLN